MKNWKAFKAELLKNRKTEKEYERLRPRYQLISQLIEARLKKGLTQNDLAEKIGTKQSAIARIESGNFNLSLDFLEKMINGLNSQLVIQVR